MKISLCVFSLILLNVLLVNLPVLAQTTLQNVASSRSIATIPSKANAAKMATVTPFITGLQEPQGLSYGVGPELSILVCDYGSGDIVSFNLNGQKQGVIATGLKGPSQVVVGTVLTESPDKYESVIHVTERKANQVTAIDRQGKRTLLGGEIPEPLGLVMGNHGLMTSSHSTSKIYRFEGLLKHQWELVYTTPEAPPTVNSARQGYSCLISDSEGYLLSDQASQKILMLTGGGKVATFSNGISHPSGLVVGPDKMVYVASESNGGQLIRLSAEGIKTVVAENLGRPHSILFCGDKTAFVSNRDGIVWKVTLPDEQN